MSETFLLFPSLTNITVFLAITCISSWLCTIYHHRIFLGAHTHTHTYVYDAGIFVFLCFYTNEIMLTTLLCNFSP